MCDHTRAKGSTQFRSLFCSLVFDPALTLGQVTSTKAEDRRCAHAPCAQNLMCFGCLVHRLERIAPGGWLVHTRVVQRSETIGLRAGSFEGNAMVVERSRVVERPQLGRPKSVHHSLLLMWGCRMTVTASVTN